MESKVSAASLKDFAAALLAKGGFTEGESQTIAASLVLSELTGHNSHGLMRIRQYLHDIKKGNTVSGAEIRIIQETESSLIIDAQCAAGQVVMPQILDRLQSKLETQATVSAAVRNSGHIGRLGEWVEIAARAGYPGLLLVNDNGMYISVAPPGGKKAVTSTNPLAFAIPLSDDEVFVTDMSTSSVAFGKIRVAHMNGKSVTPDCIQDAEGNMTTDPLAMFSDPPGSILPMGGAQGYKGFALSMFIDMLVAGLSGGQTPPGTGDAKQTNNFLLTLWNPKIFAGLEHMQDQAKKYIASIRATPPTDSAKPIRIPGDRMNSSRKQQETQGIVLDDGLRNDLLKLAEQLGVTVPKTLKE